ncbi:MAG TPA: hypothetical protein VMY34_00810, partial [Acidimicrobiales bacterium]|nr:hypothetical protein [Acidimicrobiales bacterium]
TELARWLSGDLSFDAFWEWLAPLQLQLTQDGPSRRLLYQIIGRLDEYDHGDWSDAQLRAMLTTLSREPIAAN